DFAPVGYFTFDERGRIQEINLAGASLLGIERELLTNIPISRFIADTKGKKVFSRHLKNVLKEQGIQGCELKLNQQSGEAIYAQLKSSALKANASQGRNILSSIVDVTLAKKLEDEIQDAREYSENIVETLRAPLLVLDSDLEILTANRCFYETFKVTPEETIGHFIYDVGNRQWDIPHLRLMVEEILPQNTIVKDYEVEHDFPGIGHKFILLNARQIFREKIGSDIILLAMEDITERKQAEAALIQAGALQSAIFHSANFSSIATDEKGVIQIFNVGAERMLGYTAAEVVNRITPADISDPQELIVRAQALSAELETEITPGFDALVFKARRGIEDIYELTYIRKDGSRFPAVVSVTALRDVRETIIGYLLIGTDNTMRRQIEEEQKELSQRLQDQQFYTRNLIEANSDAITTTDPAGIITDVNKQMEALTGRTREELIGAPFKDYFTDPSLVEAGIKRVLEEINISNYELTARARDGKETVVSFNANIFYDRDSRLQGLFFGARDVTERKRMDKALLEKNIELESARSVAEKANLAKSDFLSSMSHELRTPLGAILGFAQLMESGKPEPTPVQKRSIDQILKAGWYLLELINEILDLALIESGKLALSLEPVSIEEVLRECEVMVEPQAKERKIQVIFADMKEAYFVNADRTRVKQLLLNLLSNAIKYNKEYGTVTVSCSLPTADVVRISVRDTGEGLTPEQLAQLFQPFNRLGQQGDVEEGTGIGLVVCKRLVELMGGVIGVESTVGEGSVFWFELIMTTERQVSTNEDQCMSSAAATDQTGEQKSTLLYIEDNPANLMLVEDLLARRPDIRFLSAKEAITGIEIARTSLPDIILMDINLPGISGIDALKLLANIPETAHIPVVALSANAIPRDIEKGLEAGFFRYLTKPIKVTEFMDTLDMTLKHAQAEAAKVAKKGKSKS
ncbi:MAG: PAS domain S-box protein, partial [Desulfuromonadales bacterium]|nr:PAS domain S-box protein [Desulfuromonadales bacterium]